MKGGDDRAGILEIDAGNSRIKWRLLRGREVQARGVCAGSEELREMLPSVSAVDRIRASSVRGQEATATLVADLNNRWQKPVELARVTAAQSGVRNGYENFAALGVDRWLAMLAAYNRAPGSACCVISCGTALTVDDVAADGQHQGGYIVPGLSLQRKSLLRDTAIRLPQDIQWSDLPLPDESEGLGRTTEQAVSQGILSLLARGLANLPQVVRTSRAGTLYLSGGDAGTLSAALLELGLPQTCEQDIILDGLAYALPEFPERT